MRGTTDGILHKCGYYHIDGDDKEYYHAKHGMIFHEKYEEIVVSKAKELLANYLESIHDSKKNEEVRENNSKIARELLNNYGLVPVDNKTNGGMVS